MQSDKSANTEEIAEAARVSKITIYQYFPAPELLIADIMFDSELGTGMCDLRAIANSSGTAGERLDAIIHADHALVIEHENAFRIAIGTILTADSEGESSASRRPGNRLNDLADALSPLGNRHVEVGLQRTVPSLPLCVGIERIVVSRDICGLEPYEAEALKCWAAAILNTALQVRQVPPLAPEVLPG